ncbi:hypothetical protein RRG08_051937 [Elysia crispata]|uniref:Uncharacterized protein n=1 Tax=Elysia crispata TaxID=231223 RepID=A0AAE0Y1X5_9GAST|nr:hypothetical protein RRG08_051937 [Elysia crispata]
MNSCEIERRENVGWIRSCRAIVVQWDDDVEEQEPGDKTLTRPDSYQLTGCISMVSNPNILVHLELGQVTARIVLADDWLTLSRDRCPRRDAKQAGTSVDKTNTPTRVKFSRPRPIWSLDASHGMKEVLSCVIWTPLVHPWVKRSFWNVPLLILVALTGHKVNRRQE